MIGNHYRNDYHCAHFFAEWYAENLGIHIPIERAFEISFVLWLRRNFVQIEQPEENCLIKMTTPDDRAHVGVYSNFTVWHNYKVTGTNGAVCRDSLGMIQRTYGKVTFWKWNNG
tara:strand:- start:5876 stop:6217 length:342 start_codon:yes stop_codon:yes gene_type:complete